MEIFRPLIPQLVFRNGSSVNGSGGASTDGPSTAKAEPVNRDRRCGLRRTPRKERDPQFVYSDDIL